MKIGYLTACMQQLDLETIAEWAAEKGFQALELAAWPIDPEQSKKGLYLDAQNVDKAKAERMKSLFSQHDLEISALAYYDNNLHPDAEKRQFYHDHLKKVIDTASLLDVELVGTFVGSNPNLKPADNINEIVPVFQEMCRYAADRGVKLMIENCPMPNWVKFGMPGNYAWSPELWDELFEKVPNDNFGLNLDPSHLYWLGIDYIQATIDFAEKIFHAHAKDTEILLPGQYRYGILGRQIDYDPWASGWWRYRMPGLGEIDWTRFITTLQEYGYDDVISIEHEDPVWEGSVEKVKTGLQLGLKHLSRFVVK